MVLKPVSTLSLGPAVQLATPPVTFYNNEAISSFLTEAAAGKPVYIGNVREAFKQSSLAEKLTLRVHPTNGDHKHDFHLRIPDVESLPPEQVGFITEYLKAELGNILATLGGRQLTLFTDKTKPELGSLLEGVQTAFQLNREPHQRDGFGKFINVAERILEAMGEKYQPIRISVEDIKTYTPDNSFESAKAVANRIFTQASHWQDGARAIMGIDIGGSDIKAVLAVDGKLVDIKLFDWDPQSYTTNDQIAGPIKDIVRLMRLAATLKINSDIPKEVYEQISPLIDNALKRSTSYTPMLEIIEGAERKLAEYLVPLCAIGMCFPDVCINGFIVGGEAPKTEGMREHWGKDYEDEFRKLSVLANDLFSFTHRDGGVGNINDGPMAAWTTGVELAATGKGNAINGGLFVHTIGTDLGSGVVGSDGRVPDQPLEVYKLVLDLGNHPAQGFDADDVRSTLNTNTDLPGTPQKSASQAGAFRLAEQLFQALPDLYNKLFERGFLERQGKNIRVPADKRKTLLEHLMQLPSKDGRDVTKEVFREIGRYLGHVYLETERLLDTNLNTRYIFGRLAMDPTCFKLMQEGAREVAPELNLIPADDTMAHTPLMEQLAESRDHTVAQFGQAIGAVYFANSALKGDTNIFTKTR